MARIETIEWYDADGSLERQVEVELPDLDPTPEERIAQLEERLTGLTETMEAVGEAGSFAEAKAAIKSRTESDVSPEEKHP